MTVLFELNNQVDTITKTRIIDIYVDIYDKLNHEFDITFEIAIQLDDLLPLSGMSILPNCVIGDIN